MYIFYYESVCINSQVHNVAKGYVLLLEYFGKLRTGQIVIYITHTCMYGGRTKYQMGTSRTAHSTFSVILYILSSQLGIGNVTYR